MRYYGAFANRARAPKASSEQQTPPAAGPGASADAASELVQRRRASSARLIQKIFEVDPLLCVCGAEMKIVSIITDPRVVDRILRHLESQACRARTRSSRARHRSPAAIPCHEFQRRPLEHSVNLDPKLRTLYVCLSGAPNVARICWGERIFQKRFLEPAFRPAKPDLIAQQGSHLRWPLETFRCIRDRMSYSFDVRESLAEVLGLVGDNRAIPYLQELSKDTRGQIAALANQAQRRIMARNPSQ